MIAALAQIVLCERSLGAAICRSRVLRDFGSISYSLYLWQQLFLVTSTPSWERFRELPFSMILPIFIAASSYHLIERPILRLKERLVPQAR